MQEKFVEIFGLFSCSKKPPDAYTGKIGKGGDNMEPINIPRGDVDDLIYREEWTVSDR